MRQNLQFVKFWFNYVYPFKSEIEIGNFQAALTQWEKSFENVVAQNYELIIREMVRKEQKIFLLSPGLGGGGKRTRKLT